MKHATTVAATVVALAVGAALAVAQSQTAPAKPANPAAGQPGHAMAGTAKDAAPAAPKAVAHLMALGSSGVSGTVTFTKMGDHVMVSAELKGLTPGKHGFHIHEFGDCSAADGSSAGGHFNPTSAPHAGHDAAQRHVGDLGNLEAGADGTAKLALHDMMVSFDGPSSILGRGVIVHEKADDLTTQPTGAAGGRVACGVIGVSK